MRQSTVVRRHALRLGAWVEPGRGVRWRVWAPGHLNVEVVLPDRPRESFHLMREGPPGYFSGGLSSAGPGLRYMLRLDGTKGPYPDPWSRSQPEGVHGPSEVVVEDFPWTDAGWKGVSAESLVLYEVHVGTATPEGTFEALIPRLRGLRELGVTALELMPVASFGGTRNWGYDGVSLFAPAAVYGGPTGLRRLVDAAHAEGLAVFLDGVYNHIGENGNYMYEFTPLYFNEEPTLWGLSPSFDGKGRAVVRELVLSNVEMWVADYHVDGLRLDATHALRDSSQPHILVELGARARGAAPDRQVLVLAEDLRYEPRCVHPPERGGHGLDGFWADDFLHQSRRAFTGEGGGGTSGAARDLARTLTAGLLHGDVDALAAGTQPWQLIHCLQNHDQVGNRLHGDRLRGSPAAFRAMSTLLLLSPYTPLLFMGQEWDASTPFFFFADHAEDVVETMRQGRITDFFSHERERAEQMPHPFAESTFLRSKLDWSEVERPGHAGVRALYAALLRLRATEPCLRERRRGHFDAWAVGDEGVVLERRGPDAERLHVVVALRGAMDYQLPSRTRAEVVLWSEAPAFHGARAEAPYVESGLLRLEGPAAVVLRVTDAGL